MSDRTAVAVLAIESLNYNVKRFVVEKPGGYEFQPGQATEVAIDKDGWRDEKRPFTFTSLPDNPLLEFTIKGYLSHDGVTEQLHKNLAVGDRLLLDKSWGAITYQGAGIFIAGGAGVTPFIAILRRAEQEGKLGGNRLFFSNSRRKDVFMEAEFRRILGDAVIFTLTQEQHPDYASGRIERAWLEDRVQEFEQPFYVCGPPSMVEDLSETLQDLGAEPDQVVIEE